MSGTRVQEPPHLVTDLRTLNLSAMAAHWERLAEQARRARQAHPTYLAELAHLEVTTRREKRIKRRTTEAHFPMMKTLDGFDFKAASGLDRDEVLELFECGFVEDHTNVVFLGGVGTGKTHLAIALGLACCQADYRVRFTTAAELTTMLVEARAEDRLSRKLAQLARFDVVVLDELGYVPFEKSDADLLFGFITKVYEHRSLIVTTNLAFSRWSEVFPNASAAAAVIDRVVHRATILKTEGESYRLRDARKRETRRRRGKEKVAK